MYTIRIYNNKLKSRTPWMLDLSLVLWREARVCGFEDLDGGKADFGICLVGDIAGLATSEREPTIRGRSTIVST